MCLDRLDEKVKPCKKGYKVMAYHEGQLRSECQGNRDIRQVGVWLDEKDARNPIINEPAGRIRTGRLDYPMGWHVFHSKRAVSSVFPLGSLHIVRVEVDEPIATGWESGYKVTVSKKIKITEVLG